MVNVVQRLSRSEASVVYGAAKKKVLLAIDILAFYKKFLPGLQDRLLSVAASTSCCGNNA